jgi:Protein of unknown function (DUF3300)
MTANGQQLECIQRICRHLIAVTCALLLQGSAMLLAPQALAQAVEQSVQVPADQVDSLVAPIALYPDALLSQTLVASTYPLEIVQLQQWLEKNPDLANDQQKLADEVKKQPWDPSIQAMAALPDLVNRLAIDIQWTTDLGNVFLAQQSEVMDAIQRMRAKAISTGALKANEQQKVEPQVIDGKTVIVVEQANPEVIYVPSYSPTVVYGPPLYPYPLTYYQPPPSTGEAIAAGAISFGVGLAVGAAWGGGWGWGFGWGHNDIDVNVNNNFNRNANIQGGNRTNVSGNSWQHNPQHRGGAPYANSATANKFGGIGRPSNTSAGGDRVGNRNVQSDSARSNGLGGGSDGFNSAGTRSSSSRGASSMGSFGGGSRGGGGGGRGGGGRR